MNIAIAVAKWLFSLQHIATAVPVLVQIGSRRFQVRGTARTETA